MSINHLDYHNLRIPEDLIVFISGVPGMGKTTISYELYKVFNEFRIIEETDLIREILRGYNEYIKDEFKEKAEFLFDKIKIYDHMKFLSFDEAKQQCELMKNSLENIIIRQQRKGIPSIINGVHIIPEILCGFAQKRNIVFINLFVKNKTEIYNRLKKRNPEKYCASYMSYIYQTNIDLYSSTLKFASNPGHAFNNVDVTNSNVAETLNAVIECIMRRIKDTI